MPAPPSPPTHWLTDLITEEQYSVDQTKLNLLSMDDCTTLGPFLEIRESTTSERPSSPTITVSSRALQESPDYMRPRDRAGFTIPANYLIVTDVGIVPREMAFFYLATGHTVWDWSLKSRTRYKEVTVESLERSVLGSKKVDNYERRMLLWRTIPRSFLWDDGIRITGGRRKWLTRKEWTREMVSQPGIGMCGAAKKADRMTQQEEPLSDFSFSSLASLRSQVQESDDISDSGCNSCPSRDPDHHLVELAPSLLRRHSAPHDSSSQHLDTDSQSINRWRMMHSATPERRPIKEAPPFELDGSSGEDSSSEVSFASNLYEGEVPFESSTLYTSFLQSWHSHYGQARTLRKAKSWSL